MADHRAVAILNTFRDLMTNLPITGDNVFKGRVFDFDNTPSHSIFLGAAPVESLNTVEVVVDQLIRDEITVAGPEDELDELLLAVHAESYVAIMADATLGISYVIDTELQGMNEPDYIADGRRPILTAVFTWRVSYRHSYLDPSA